MYKKNKKIKIDSKWFGKMLTDKRFDPMSSKVDEYGWE